MRTPLPVNRDDLERFLSLTYRERGRFFDSFMNEKFFMSERVGDIRDWCLTSGQKSYRSADFNEIVYLPFEQIEIPAPVGYDRILTDYYGDWHKMIITHTHAEEWSTNISFDEYRQKSFRFNH